MISSWVARNGQRGHFRQRMTTTHLRSTTRPLTSIFDLESQVMLDVEATSPSRSVMLLDLGGIVSDWTVTSSELEETLFVLGVMFCDVDATFFDLSVTFWVLFIPDVTLFDL